VKITMSHLALVVNKYSVCLILGFFMGFSYLEAQVSRLDIDEASDVVFNDCYENQISIFLFRYPDIGSMDSMYNVLMDQFSRDSRVFLKDIRMEPIPGCSKPKLFELCGFANLNPYMNYKPILAYIGIQSRLWLEFSSSAYYRECSYHFVSVTDKESTKAPFVATKSLEGLECILRFLQRAPLRQFENSKVSPPGTFVKEVDLRADSLRILRIVLQEFARASNNEKKVPSIGGFGFKVSAFIGELKSRDLRDTSLSQVVCDMGYGNGVSAFAQFNQNLKNRQVLHQIEMGFQDFTLTGSIDESNGSMSKNSFYYPKFAIRNYAMSYSMATDFFKYDNLRFFLQGGSFFHIRSILKASESHSLGPIISYDLGVQAGTFLMYPLGKSGTQLIIEGLFSLGLVVLEEQPNDQPDTIKESDTIKEKYSFRSFGFSVGFRTPIK